MSRTDSSPASGGWRVLAVVGVLCLLLGGAGVWIAQRAVGGANEPPRPVPAESIPLAPGPDNTITTPPPKPQPETVSPRPVPPR